ncbi:hypothetical protein SAMN04488109_5610 [Chryseolinea serpens]|uniref:DUF2004 domain-containing protein n=2 Tax=Chryseolinea serpens TaxID=947013 RepID=A0A1M5WE15_9BACT|nr:hypothetical protein SAMN04488109_5610 [Chryseolinea serpens]
MGLFNLFKKTPTIRDDFFGTLTFINFKDVTKNYFEGKGKFEPTGEIIEYLIDGDLSGLTNDQKTFYNKIQNSYDEIISKITPLIEDEFKNWKEDFQINDFKKEFSLVAVAIPRLPSELIVWNISFDTIHDENHQITVEFKDFEPESISFDG